MNKQLMTEQMEAAHELFKQVIVRVNDMEFMVECIDSIHFEQHVEEWQSQQHIFCTSPDFSNVRLDTSEPIYWITAIQKMDRVLQSPYLVTHRPEDMIEVFVGGSVQCFSIDLQTAISREWDTTFC